MEHQSDPIRKLTGRLRRKRGHLAGKMRGECGGGGLHGSVSRGWRLVRRTLDGLSAQMGHHILEECGALLLTQIDRSQTRSKIYETGRRLPASKRLATWRGTNHPYCAE